MLPLTGYADRLSVRPGETLRFHVANASGHEVSARLVRVICADANPAGPGIVTEPLPHAVTLVRQPTPQSTSRGSYAVVEDVGACLGESSFGFACRLFATRIGAGQQAVVSRMDSATGHGFALLVDATGRLLARVGDGRCIADVCLCEQPLLEREWSTVWLSVDASAGTVQIGHVPVAPRLGRHCPPCIASEPLPAEAHPHASAPLLFAALDHDDPRAHFNGKLERPMLFDQALAASVIDTVIAGEDVAAASACWDFARDTAGSRIVDIGAHGAGGRLVNTPGRGMTGSRWDGRQMCPAHAPEQYGAIHFHDDDIDDCGWPVAFEWTPPAGVRSATCALILSAGEEEENIPFFVLPAKGTRTADVAVLASTFTYVIYANHARPEWNLDADWQAAWRAQTAAWGGYPHNPGEHTEYGLSTYNDHNDGSGVSIASRHRPMLNMRIGYLTFPYPDIRASGLRHFPADSHLTAWLEAKGIAYDMVTDQELHDEGVAALDGYRTVLTATHPEYHSRNTLDALEDYRDGGGRFCYLGGNGFYWKVALSAEKPGVIEIRRGEGGIRAWAAEPGEYYNQFDGEYGGLWRRNGRPPQHLTGVGFTAQGNYVGSHYRRTGEAADARVAWMFEGLDDDVIGAHGLGGHGAAGYELDRADRRLGTPRHALVVASSEGHPADAPWVLVPEEQLTHITTWAGVPASDLVRADMTFFETPNGGAVFSTGSITFCSSLPSNDFDNDVSRLLENVVRRFLDPAPFVMPGD